MTDREKIKAVVAVKGIKYADLAKHLNMSKAGLFEVLKRDRRDIKFRIVLYILGIEESLPIDRLVDSNDSFVVALRMVDS